MKSLKIPGFHLVLAAIGILSYLELAASSEYAGYAPVAAGKSLLYAAYVLAGFTISRWAPSITGLVGVGLFPAAVYALSFCLVALLYPNLSVADILMVWSLQRLVAGWIPAIPLVFAGVLLGKARFKSRDT